MTSIEDSFNPYGLKVLVVDNDPDALLHLSEMLTSCEYQVRTCSSPAEALSLIRDENNKFDLVITEVYFAPDINGVEFIEIVVRETELPVVVVLADGKTDTITECIMKGACHCMPKSAKIQDIKVLWQHVARRVLRHKLMKPIDKLEVNEPSSITSVEDKELSGSSPSDGVQMDDDQTKHQAKKRRMNWSDDSSNSDGGGQMDDDQTMHKAKKPRMNWTAELHQQFVDAVKQLGIKNAFPKKLLEIMNVPGLTRACVASHLQKYRSSLQKMKEDIQQRVIEQGSITQVPGDAYSQMFEDKDSFISTPLTTGVQQVFTEQDSSSEVPIGADSQVMENNNLFIRNSSITDLEQYFTEQDSSTHVPIGTYHPVIDWEPDWFVGSPVVSSPITDDELNSLQPFELDNSLFQFHVPDYSIN